MLNLMHNKLDSKLGIYKFIRNIGYAQLNFDTDINNNIYIK